MFSFFKNMFKKEEVPVLNTSELSIELPSAIEIESIVNQDGGAKQYYDNIYSRNISKL